MSKREFMVEIRGDIIIRLDQAVIDAVDDEWRSEFYGLWTTDDVVEHIAYNLFVNRIPLSSMDGWADQPNTNAELDMHDPRLDLGWEFEVIELARRDEVII
jgi:hypothetical protein